MKYGQSDLDVSDEMDLAREPRPGEADRAKDLRLTATEGLDKRSGERLMRCCLPEKWRRDRRKPAIRRSSCRRHRAERAGRLSRQV